MSRSDSPSHAQRPRRSSFAPLWRSARTPPAPLALTVALALTLEITGAMHLYGLRGMDGQRFAYAGALLLLLVALGWLVQLRAPFDSAITTSDQRPTTNDQRRIRCGRWSLVSWTEGCCPAHALRLLMLAAWLFTTLDLLVFIAPDAGWWLPIGCALATAALVALVVRRSAWLLGAAVLLGVAARLVSFAYLPIDPAHGDMLPLAQGALANFLRGQSPYQIYHMPWEVPLTYMPLTWLAYLPPYALGLDLRLTNVLADLAVGAALRWLLHTQHNVEAARAPSPRQQAVLLWAWVFLLPTSQHWTQATTAPVTWALMAWLLALLLAGRQRAAALALGLCAAASPLAAVVAPFALLHWARALGRRRALRLALLALAAAALWVAPFLRWSPAAFIFGTYRWFNDNDLFPRLRWEMDQTWSRYIGFSGMFWRHHLVGALKPLQGALLLALLALFWRRGAQVRQIAPMLAATFVLLTLINPVLWPYLYQPALVMALFAVAARSGVGNQEPGEETF